ncbi:hypothetical protein CSX04_03779 [Burkholderia cepacia]|nr:hypothetical protein CSX04_03779 [Burkholderia cepacia]
MTTRTETAAYESRHTAPRDARDTDRTMPLATIRTLAASAHVGDLVFIRVPASAPRDAAGTTGTWANRFGIVVDTSGDEPVIAESGFAWTKLTPLSRFVARTDGGRIALARRVAAPTATRNAGCMQRRNSGSTRCSATASTCGRGARSARTT